MQGNDFLGQGDQNPVLTLMAPDLRFLAQGLAPEIGADRLISRFAGLAALETFGIDIPAGVKEVEKESDPVRQRAGLGERRVRKCLGRDRTRNIRFNRGSALSENPYSRLNGIARGVHLGKPGFKLFERARRWQRM